MTLLLIKLFPRFTLSVSLITIFKASTRELGKELLQLSYRHKISPPKQNSFATLFWGLWELWELRKMREMSHCRPARTLLCWLKSLQYGQALLSASWLAAASALNFSSTKLALKSWPSFVLFPHALSWPVWLELDRQLQRLEAVMEWSLIAGIRD